MEGFYEFLIIVGLIIGGIKFLKWAAYNIDCENFAREQQKRMVQECKERNDRRYKK